MLGRGRTRIGHPNPNPDTNPDPNPNPNPNPKPKPSPNPNPNPNQNTNRTVLLECDPFSSPYSNRPPGFVCGGDQHATPYYALRQGRWKLLLGDPGADDNRHPSIGNG